MKYQIFIIILFVIVGCKNNSTNPEELFFNADQLNSLGLGYMDRLWQGEPISRNTTDWFLHSPEGYTDGLELSSESSRIFILVFESKEIALELTEEFLTTIAMYTEEKNDHSIIKERWWSQPNSNSSIFVNKFNTLISLTHTLDVDSDFTQNIAVEIMNRIEEKSK